jgi:YD repeat-containing protein
MNYARVTRAPRRSRRRADTRLARPIREQNVADPQDTTIYAWDVHDRLVALRAPGIEASFAYDALGRRVQRTVNGETTRYVYDGIQAIGEILGNQATTPLTGLVIDEIIARYSDRGGACFSDRWAGKRDRTNKSGSPAVELLCVQSLWQGHEHGR